VDRIVLWPLGGFTVFGASHGAVIDDLWVAIAGPVTHILQGGFWIGIYAAVNHGDFSEFSTAGDFSEYSTAIILAELQDGGEFVSVLAAQTVVINVVLFIFNLAVPAYPLDGGRAFAALLVMGGFELATAARITSVTGIFNGLIMLFIGVYFYVIQNSAGALFLVLVAGFIIDSGLQLLKAVSVSRVYDHPLFQLDCYHNQGNVLRSLTASTTPPRIPLTNVV
jgi:Zn-dependent protease